MRRTTPAIRVALIAALATFAMLPGVPAARAQSSQANAPRVEVNNPVYNFGTALEGNFVEHVFELKNTGKSDLTISGVHTSCGCTAAAPSKKRLAPGDSADLKVAFDTRFQKGTKVRTINVFTNDPQTPNLTLTLQGEVKVEVVATPSEVSFGKVRYGSEATQQVVVGELAKSKDFKVSAAKNASPNIRVTQASRKDGKPGADLEVRLLKTMPIGPFDDTIEVVTSRRPIQVHIFGQVTGDLALDPAQISFGIVPRGQGSLRMLKLTNQGATPVQVTGVTSSNQSVAAKVEPIAPGKEYKITVELRKGTPNGQLRGEIAIKTNDPRQATLTVPFYGIIGSFES